MAQEEITWDTPKTSSKQQVAAPMSEDIVWDRENVAAETPRTKYTLGEVPAAAFKNLPKSAGKFVGGLYEAVTSPIQTAKGLLDVGAGAIQNVLPQGVVDFVNSFSSDPANAERAVAAANAVGGMFKDRYGDFEKIKRTLAEDPVGAAADLSTLFSGGALATTKVPAVSTALGKAATVTNPLAAVTKPVEAFTKNKLATQSVEQQLNAVRDANVASAQAAGYVVTPGSLTPNSKNILAERIAGKTHLEQLASVKNQAVTDRLARQAVGLDETAPLTSDTMATIRKSEYAKGYEPVKKLGSILVDDQYLDDLAKVENIYTGPSKSFPGAVPDEVGKTIEKYLVNKFDAGDAVDVTRNLREQASANFRKGENALAKAQLDISNALENQIERSLNAAKRPDAATLLEQFKLSRQRMAVSHTIEDAIREGAGSVNAKTLARDLQSGKYMTGELKTIAEFANVFPRVSQAPGSIGTPGAGAMLGRSFSGLAAGSLAAAATSNPLLGLAVGLAPEATSAATRAYMLSPLGQSRIAPRYNRYQGLQDAISDEAIRNTLLLQQAGELNKNQNALTR